MTPETIKRVWRKLLAHLYSVASPYTLSDMLREAVRMVRHIPGGFRDITRDSILQLVISEVSLTMDDIMQEVEEEQQHQEENISVQGPTSKDLILHVHMSFFFCVGW